MKSLLCSKKSKIIMKKVNSFKVIVFGILFWILQLTWGILMTFAGAVFSVIALVFLKGKPHKNGYSVIIEFGGNWGGLSLGAFTFCGNYSKTDVSWYSHTRMHEAGHSIQNIIFGPLFPLIIGIPSVCRWIHMRNMERKGMYIDPKWYESIWFEKDATSMGEFYIGFINLWLIDNEIKKLMESSKKFQKEIERELKEDETNGKK